MSPRTCWSFCWLDCQMDGCQKGLGLSRCKKCGKHRGLETRITGESVSNFFYCITVKRHTNERCRSDDRERDVHGHAARRRGEKHLTVREKSQISQAHAQTKPSPLSTHAFLHRQHAAKARPALQSADLLEVRRAERVLSAAKSH